MGTSRIVRQYRRTVLAFDGSFVSTRSEDHDFGIPEIERRRCTACHRDFGISIGHKVLFDGSHLGIGRSGFLGVCARTSIQQRCRKNRRQNYRLRNFCACLLIATSPLPLFSYRKSSVGAPVRTEPSVCEVAYNIRPSCGSILRFLILVLTANELGIVPWISRKEAHSQAARW